MGLILGCFCVTLGSSRRTSSPVPFLNVTLIKVGGAARNCPQGQSHNYHLAKAWRTSGGSPTAPSLCSQSPHPRRSKQPQRSRGAPEHCRLGTRLLSREPTFLVLTSSLGRWHFGWYEGEGRLSHWT